MAILNLNSLFNNKGLTWNTPRSTYNPYNPNDFKYGPGNPSSVTVGNQPSLRIIGTPAPAPKPSGGGIVGGTGDVLGTNDQVRNVEQTRDEGYDLVEREYDQALSALSEAEANQKAFYSTQEAQAQAEGKSIKNRLTEAKGREFDLATEQEQVARDTERVGLREVRDLFRDLQQQNVAQLSALGISSSSVTEALAERLGVNTQRSIGDITGKTRNIINNIAKEKTRIEQIYNSKVQELDEKVGLQVQQIRNQMSEALSSISSQRDLAAIQKQRQRYDIAQNARNLIYNIQQQARDLQQKYALAAQRRAQEADQYIQLLSYNDQGVGQLNPAVQNSLSALQNSAPGIGYAPEVKYKDGTPYVTGYSSYNLPDEEEEQSAYDPTDPNSGFW